MEGTRILALDHGTKRIGVALSDEMGWTGQPLETYRRRTLEADLKHIDHLVREHKVTEVVIGMPFRLDGGIGPAAQSVQEFVKRLEAVLTVPVTTWDERMTTKAAEELLIAADVSRKKRKGTVDRIAAAMLLQSYLESRANPPEDRHAGDDMQAVSPTEDVDEDATDPLDLDPSVPHGGDGLPGSEMGPTTRR